MQKERIDYKYILNSNYLSKPAYNPIYKVALIISASAMLSTSNPVLATASYIRDTGEILVDNKNVARSCYIANIGGSFLPTQTEIMDVSKMENYNKLKDFKKLEFDWNGNKAAPFDHALIEKCMDVLNQLKYQPEIFPTACNSIQFEYEKATGEYLEFEIFDSYIHVFKIDADENEIEFVENDITKINEMVDTFYG